MSKAVKGIAIGVPLAFALVGCTTTPTAEDPVYLKLTDLEARLMRIERVIENQSLIELASQVDQLQSETQALRGELETMAYQTNNAAERQRELYVDVDTRLQGLEMNQSRLAEPPPVAVTGVPADTATLARPALAGSDQDNYQMAFDLLKDGRYEESATAFEQFLTVFPSSPLADNAQYWLAETYYVQRQFTTALPAFERVANVYPDSAKLPDALLKIGYCNYELKNWGAAHTALSTVRAEFPESTAARLALQRLERMKEEGV